MNWHGCVLVVLVPLTVPNCNADELSVAEIISNLRRVEAAAVSMNYCVDMRVASRVWRYTADVNYRSNFTADTHWAIRTDGSKSYEGAVKHILNGSDGSVEETVQNERSVYFTPSGRARNVSKGYKRSGQIRVDDDNGNAFVGPKSPFELIGRAEVIDSVKKTGATVIAGTFVDGRSACILKTKPCEQAGGQFSTYDMVWLDSERWTLLRRQVFTKNATDSAWHLSMQISCKQFERASEDDPWLPRHVHVWLYEMKDGTQKKVSETHCAVGAWRTALELPDSQFDLSFRIYAPVDW